MIVSEHQIRLDHSEREGYLHLHHSPACLHFLQCLLFRLELHHARLLDVLLQLGSLPRIRNVDELKVDKYGVSIIPMIFGKNQLLAEHYSIHSNENIPVNFSLLSNFPNKYSSLVFFHQAYTDSFSQTSCLS